MGDQFGYAQWEQPRPKRQMSTLQAMLLALAIILVIVLAAVLWQSHQDAKRQEILELQSDCVARAMAWAAFSAGEGVDGLAAQRVAQAYLNGSICQ